MKRLVSFFLSMTMVMGMMTFNSSTIFANEIDAEVLQENFNTSDSDVEITDIEEETDEEKGLDESVELAASYDVTYAVEGGNIYFDSTTGTIVACEKSVTKAVIPNEINNVSVTRIEEYAFINCSIITSIEIPNSVTSIGDNAFYGCSSLTSIEIPNSVTRIGSFAFRHCSSLTSIEIPNSVTSIGYGAFSVCSSIKTAGPIGSGCNYEFGWTYKIPDYAFSSCSSLESIEIPNSVTSIGDYAFNGCSSLTSIEIPNSVTSMDRMVFEHCSSLTSIEIPNGVTSIGDSEFAGCSSLESIEIPNSVTSIGEYAFTGCSSLESIEIPNSVTSIGMYAFSSCSSLESIEIPNSVTSIEHRAFDECSSLTSIEISNSITSIGDSMFYECSSLKSVEIPNSVTSIGDSVFYECSSLESVEIPNSVTSIGDSVFYNCSSLESIEIPNSVTSIGEYAFSGCSSLKSVEISNSVTSIGYSVFLGCSSLESIEIPNSVMSIGVMAFSGCSSLESIEIPNSVTSIGGYAFSGCISLTSIEIPNSVTSIGEYAFLDCNYLTMYVEKDSYAEEYAIKNSIKYEYITGSEELACGDYIKMGNYYGEDILWRCVGYEKIKGYDDNGNPIMDATDISTNYKEGYLPLMVSDKILCLKAFDVGGANTKGSHGRSDVENRKQYGSNYWGDSNIRDWLNSIASAGNVKWTCGNPPISNDIADGNDYADEAGFLKNFKSNELAVIKKVTQKSILDGFEYSDEVNPDYLQNPIGSLAEDGEQNYSTAFSELCTDKMFLLDVKQALSIYENLNDALLPTLTKGAVANNTNKKYQDFFTEGMSWHYWLRTPHTDVTETEDGITVKGYFLREMSGYNIEDTAGASDSANGVRPAFFLDYTSMEMFSDGNGTSNQPYVIGKDIIYKEDAVYGDTDGNGVITVNDAVELLENVLDKNNKIGIEGSAIDYKEYIDLNKDGNITAEDVSMILQRVLNENK